MTLFLVAVVGFQVGSDRMCAADVVAKQRRRSVASRDAVGVSRNRNANGRRSSGMMMYLASGRWCRDTTPANSADGGVVANA